jgi:peroxiredoxin
MPRFVPLADGRLVPQMEDGDTVPSVTFHCRVRDESIGGENPFTFKKVTSSDIMTVKNVFGCLFVFLQ